MGFTTKEIILILIIVIPFAYYIYRDFLLYYRDKREAKEQEQKYIETEKRVYKMLKETQKTRIEVIENLERLKDEMAKNRKEGVPDILVKDKNIPGLNEEKKED